MSTTIIPQSKGGKVRALIQRSEALKRYYSNPNICLDCKSIIPVQSHQKVREARNKKFCNRICYGKYKKEHSPETKIISCTSCNSSLLIQKLSNGDFSKQKLCGECRKSLNVKNSSELLQVTKGELFSVRLNYQSARSAIQKLARKIFRQSVSEPSCIICGYNAHVEVAHIKSVSSFSNNSTIGEINSTQNLVGLCPNHHWEYDNNRLSLDAVLGVEPSI